MSEEQIDAMVGQWSQLNWLDSMFLQKCLQRICNDRATINVMGFDVAPATKKGENFASDIFRVNVQFTEDHQSNDLIDQVSATPEIRYFFFFFLINWKSNFLHSHVAITSYRPIKRTILS